VTRAQRIYVDLLRRGIWLRRRGEKITWGDAKVSPDDVQLIRVFKPALLDVVDTLDVSKWATLVDPRGGVFSVHQLSPEFCLAIGEAA
jgi:hypothetical protein